MLKENRSETDDLHRTIAAKDAELLSERNVFASLELFPFGNLLFFQRRLQIEEQFRQQLENEKRLEDMQIIESSSRNLFFVRSPCSLFRANEF